jgi:hypothetical protein
MSINAIASTFASDTTIVEFTDKKSQKRITVITPDDNRFEIPVNLNLENLLKEMGIDSSQRNRALVLVGRNEQKQDTILVISQEGQRISIIANEKLQTVSKRIIAELGKDGKTEEGGINEQNELGDSEEDKKYEQESKRFFSKSDFGFYIGLNGFHQDPQSAQAKLRTWPSRYIALSFRKNMTLFKGNQMELALSYAPEFAWYNFMFVNNNGVDFENEQISFVDLNKATKKSKLVVPNINLPVMLHFGFKEAKFKFGVGGYVGYRIGGYSKIKETNNNKDKIKANYGLENFQYGLTAEAGKRRGLTVFFRYQLNDLFQSNQLNASGVRPFSIGLRI